MSSLPADLCQCTPNIEQLSKAPEVAVNYEQLEQSEIPILNNFESVNTIQETSVTNTNLARETHKSTAPITHHTDYLIVSDNRCIR